MFPGEKTVDFRLEDKDNTYASIEAAEVGRHGCYIEGGTLGGGALIGTVVFIRGEVFSWYDLL